MKFSELTECPFCGHDEFYEIAPIKGHVYYIMRYDGKEAEDNSSMYDGTSTYPTGRVYCDNCHKYLGNYIKNFVGGKAEKALTQKGVD